MKVVSVILLLFSFFVTVLSGHMTLYEKRDGKAYERVLIPVSSTVIPLDDLPQYRVGVRLGIAEPPPGLVKPENIKLITAKKSKKKFSEKKPVRKVDWKDI